MLRSMVHISPAHENDVLNPVYEALIDLIVFPTTETVAHCRTPVVYSAYYIVCLKPDEGI